MLRTALLLAILAGPAYAEPRVDQHGDPLPDGAIVRFGTMRHRIGSARSVKTWAMSPDGKTLAVEDRHGMTLWDIDSGMPVKQFATTGRLDESFEFGLKFSPDGKSLARLAGRKVTVLDATTGKERFSHDVKALGGARQMAYIANPPRLVITHEDLQKAHFLDADSGKLLKTVETEVPIWNLCSSGKYFLGWGQGVPSLPHLVDATTGKVRTLFSDANGANAFNCALSPDSTRFYVSQDDGRLQTFDAETGKLVEDLKWPVEQDGEGDYTKLSISADGGTAYFSTCGQPTRRRDLKAGKWLEPLPKSGGGPVVTLPDGKRVLQIGKDGVLRQYDLATLKQLPLTEGFEGKVVAQPSPDGLSVLAMSKDTAGTRMDLFGMDGKRRWSQRVKAQATVDWSPDSKQISSISRDTIVLRDAETGKELRTIRFGGDGDEFWYGWFSPDGNGLIVLRHEGQEILRFDPKTGERTSIMKFADYSRISPSPNRRTLLLDGVEDGLAIFDLETKKFLTGRVDKLPEKPRRWLARIIHLP